MEPTPDADYDLIKAAEAVLVHAIPDPPSFKDGPANSEEEAMTVYRSTRRVLLFQLLMQEYHEHVMDDCGDYLTTALENFHNLHMTIWTNDFTNLIPEVNKFLSTPIDANEAEDDVPYPWGASDGEVRYALIGDPYDKED